MNRKKHPNRKKHAFVRAATAPKRKGKKIDYSLYGTITMFFVFSAVGLLMGFYGLYDTYQKLPVYQKGRVVNMRMVEKSAPDGKGKRSTTNIKLYYDGCTYSEIGSTYEYSHATIGSNIPRRFLKGSPIILRPNETLLGGFVISIALILLFGGGLFFIIREWYDSRFA